MYKMLFPNTNINEVSKSINKKVVFHAYNNSCILQMGICRVTLFNKGIAYQCNFFIIHGNVLALLGMPDCEWLQMLSINCQKTNNQCKRRQVNEQTKQDNVM